MAQLLTKTGRLRSGLAIANSLLRRDIISRNFGLGANRCIIKQQQQRTPACVTRITTTRWYSSDQGREDDDQQQARAFAFQLMSPLAWIRIKLNTVYIQSKLDQEFTLESFMQGACQAFKVLLGCLTNNDYGSLEGLVTSEAMEWLRENYHGADPELDFTLKNHELIVKKPKNIAITELDGNLNRVHVDTLFAAVKIKDKPYMITGVLRFQRDYTGEAGEQSEWVISEVQQLMVKEVGSVSF